MRREFPKYQRKDESWEAGAGRRRQRVLFVVNPISGGRSKEGLDQKIHDFLRGSPVMPEIIHTTGEADAEMLEREIARFDPEIVAACGGDGTVRLVGEALLHSPRALAILPLGSANGLAKELGIPLSVEEALRLLLNGKTRPIDILSINDLHAFHLVDFGFNARVVEQFSQSKLRGLFTYGWHCIKEFFRFKPKYYHIRTPNFEFHGKAFMVIVTNASMFGSKLTINPVGEIDDGIFEITVIHRFPRLQSLAILYRMLTDSIHKSSYCRIIQATEAEVSPLKPRVFNLNIDGEATKISGNIRFRIIKHAIQVLVPA